MLEHSNPVSACSPWTQSLRVALPRDHGASKSLTSTPFFGVCCVASALDYTRVCITPRSEDYLKVISLTPRQCIRHILHIIFPRHKPPSHLACPPPSSKPEGGLARALRTLKHLFSSPSRCLSLLFHTTKRLDPRKLKAWV